MMGGFYVLLFCMVLCILHPVQAVAADYTVFVPDSISDDMSAPAVYPDENIDEIELINDLATPSDVQFLATPSDFDFGGVQSLAAYNRPYDGSMSSSVINYFDDIVQKLGCALCILPFRSVFIPAYLWQRYVSVWFLFFWF